MDSRPILDAHMPTDYLVTASTSALEPIMTNDSEIREDRLTPLLACRKYLLEAGCDPTIPRLYNSKPESNSFETTISDGSPVCSLWKFLLLTGSWVLQLEFKLTFWLFCIGGNTARFGFWRRLCQCEYTTTRRAISTSITMPELPLERGEYCSAR